MLRPPLHDARLDPVQTDAGDLRRQQVPFMACRNSLRDALKSKPAAGESVRGLRPHDDNGGGQRTTARIKTEAPGIIEVKASEPATEARVTPPTAAVASSGMATAKAAPELGYYSLLNSRRSRSNKRRSRQFKRTFSTPFVW